MSVFKKNAYIGYFKHGFFPKRKDSIKNNPYIGTINHVSPHGKDLSASDYFIQENDVDDIKSDTSSCSEYDSCYEYEEKEEPKFTLDTFVNVAKKLSTDKI